MNKFVSKKLLVWFVITLIMLVSLFTGRVADPAAMQYWFFISISYISGQSIIDVVKELGGK